MMSEGTLLEEKVHTKYKYSVYLVHRLILAPCGFELGT